MDVAIFKAILTHKIIIKPTHWHTIPVEYSMAYHSGEIHGAVHFQRHQL